MANRTELLRVIEEDNYAALTQFVKEHGDDLEEILGEFNEKQLESVWSKLQHNCNSSLLNFDEEENQLEICANLQSIVKLGRATLSLKETTPIPTPMLQTAVVLHGILLTLPDPAEKLKNSISELCEDWWHGSSVSREDLAPQTFMYLLQRSLRPEATNADVKRVNKMRECLEHINLSSDSSNTLRNLLLHCYITNTYFKTKDGQSFLAYLFGLNLDFIETIHKTIKNHISLASNLFLQVYGQVYFIAWKVAGDQFLDKIEQSCLQDLMWHAVHADRVSSRSLSFKLRKILSYIHHQKMSKGVDEMLLRLYEPIIWRSLKVANPAVRANSAALLLDAFPLQAPQAANAEADTLLQKQFDIFVDLLYDPCSTVRSLVVGGVCKILADYWELIPLATIKTLILHLIQDLAWDAAAADVRYSVVKGLTVVLQQPLSHTLMKAVLPELQNLIHDTSERVRVAMVDLLLKVKSLRAIKFWNVVPMDHLLARLEIDDSPVVKRISHLLLSSYLPIEKPIDVQITRCIAMIQKSPGAARRFYQYAPNHLDLQHTVSFMVELCKCVRECVKESEGNEPSVDEQNKENDVEKDNLVSSEDENDDEPVKENTSSKENTSENTSTGNTTAFEISADNTDIIAGLLETVLILWKSIDLQLNKTQNKDSKRHLQARLSHVLPSLFRNFHDTKITASCIMLASFLTPNTVPVISRSLMSKLKNMDSSYCNETWGPMLEALCRWGRISDILDLITDWIKANLPAPSSTKVRRKTRSVGFVEPCVPQPDLALKFLTYIMQHQQCREVLLAAHSSAGKLNSTLSNVTHCLVERFTSTVADDSKDEFLTSAFSVHCKFTVLLHTKENSAVSVFEKLLSWAEIDALRLLRSSSTSRPKGRKLMSSNDATLLATPDETFLQQTLDTTAINATLLNDTLFAPSTLKRSNASANSELLTNVLKVLVNVTSNMLLVGISDEQFRSHIADFSLHLLKVDRDCNHYSDTIGLLYQLTELILTDGKDASSIAKMLTSVVKLIGKVCKEKKEQSSAILQSLKPALVGMMTSYYRHSQITANCEIMKVVAETVIEEVTRKVKEDSNMEECKNLADLPVVSCFFLSLIIRKSMLIDLFWSEVHSSLNSGQIIGLESYLACLHIIRAVQSGNTEYKNCIKTLQHCLDTLQLPDDLLEESPIHHMKSTATHMLSVCSSNANIIL